MVYFEALKAFSPHMASEIGIYMTNHSQGLANDPLAGQLFWYGTHTEPKTKLPLEIQDLNEVVVFARTGKHLYEQMGMRLEHWKASSPFEVPLLSLIKLLLLLLLLSLVLLLSLLRMLLVTNYYC